MAGVAWWSTTAANNATYDPTVNFQEGQTPSSLNDSSRAAMASVAKWNGDISGAITTAGVGTAYTVASNQQFDTLARLNNQLIAFSPHTTNTGTCTLNTDGLGAKPLRSAPSVDLPAGTIIQGTPYVALYNNGDGAYYLHGFFGQPWSIPIGGLMDFIGSTAPNSSFVFPYGQAISRTTYATLFALVGTTYGSGDGSSTFNIPDLRGRVIAGKDDMGGSAASRLTSSYFGTSAAALGAVGGGESHTLTLAQLPTITSVNASQAISVTSTASNVLQGSPVATTVGTGGFTRDTIVNPATVSAITSTANNSISVTSNGTSGNAHRTVQPTIICNKLLRII